MVREKYGFRWLESSTVNTTGNLSAEDGVLADGRSPVRSSCRCWQVLMCQATDGLGVGLCHAHRFSFTLTVLPGDSSEFETDGYHEYSNSCSDSCTSGCGEFQSEYNADFRVSQYGHIFFEFVLQKRCGHHVKDLDHAQVLCPWSLAVCDEVFAMVGLAQRLSSVV